MSEEKLLNLAEVCKLLDKSEVTVKRYARESLLPSQKVNGELMFPEVAVHQYVKISSQLN